MGKQQKSVYHIHLPNHLKQLHLQDIKNPHKEKCGWLFGNLYTLSDLCCFEEQWKSSSKDP